MNFIQVSDTLINLNNVTYVTKRENDGYYMVEIAFPDGSVCNNGFETIEERDQLFNDICAKTM